MRTKAFLQKFEKRSQKISLWLGLLFIAGVLGAFASTSLVRLYHQPGRTYERINMPAELNLDYKDKTARPKGDGCPCTVFWGYRYSFKQGINTQQALALAKQAIEDAGYTVTDISKEFGPGSFLFRLPERDDSVERPSVLVLPSENQDQPMDPNHIYVKISQII